MIHKISYLLWMREIGKLPRACRQKKLSRAEMRSGMKSFYIFNSFFDFLKENFPCFSFKKVKTRSWYLIKKFLTYMPKLCAAPGRHFFHSNFNYFLISDFSNFFKDLDQFFLKGCNLFEFFELFCDFSS